MEAIKFLAMFCFVLLSGSGVFGQIAETPKTVEKTASATQTADASKAADASQASPFEEKYRIGYQDSLEVVVAKHPELSQVVNVGSDGTILLPRIDRPVTAVCKTERELKANLETLYRTYLKNPYVNVRVTEQLSQPVAVIGAVSKPGTFNLRRKMKLLELLSLAGGPDVENAGAKIIVARLGNTTACTETLTGASEADDKVQFFTYKVDEVQKGTVNPWMQPGDIVNVQIAEEAYVVGDVGEPTKISLRETKTLSQAIAEAGGIKAEAKTSKVRIQRQEANSPLRTEMVFDLKDITSKKIPDPILQANDIVEVPKDGFKAIRNGVLKAISGGVGGLFLRL